MKKVSLFVVLAALVALVALPAMAGEGVTPDEIVAKCKEASAYLAEKGDAAVAEFSDPNSRWVWKDTYVFVYDCAVGECVGNITPGMVGKKIGDITTIDTEGKPVGLHLCEIANDASKPNGWWIQFDWRNPKTGETKPKLSYIYRAPGATYTVGAGIYSPEGVTAADLNAKLK
ncbi:MAG: cache domain-containing protein [Deltaproteobacteria bacterium]|nr:cache domain-containing protein [Candidatus Zymogenaceae bacterium]